MKKTLIISTVLGFILFSSCKNKASEFRSITPEVLKDKIAGGWAGKMIGVTYGAPTEFRAQSKTYDDSIKWVPADVKGSLNQDDLYVQLTFLESMDRYGLNAPAKKYQEMLAKSGYYLWHANVQARKNYYDSIFPPESGKPEFNSHADDIDFEIESDYIGFMCPGMPQRIVAIADKIGHIMNYGDGVYGGIFIAALYSEAFFENDIATIVENALKSIPAESDYYKIVKDVILLHKHYPDNWRAAWKELNAKWGEVDICGAGIAFNIDAKLNGAFVVMGLLYGNGDPMKTMEITTRCGEDSDCNPSNAMAVLGVIKGFSNLPDEMKKAVAAMGNAKFDNTDYSFNKAVKSSFNYATSFIKDAGGQVTDKEIKIKTEASVAPKLEVSFPKLVFDSLVPIFHDKAWKLKGNWKTFAAVPWDRKEMLNQAKYAEKAGDELEFSFEGSGLTITGNWGKEGGKADVYVDGKFNRTIDTYYYWNKQEHQYIEIWHAFNLEPGKHTVRLVVKGEKRPESLGTRVYVCNAIIFKNEPKKNEQYKFTFEQ